MKILCLLVLLGLSGCVIAPGYGGYGYGYGYPHYHHHHYGY